MRTIRASEVNSFLFCKRAWWYQKQGKPSENKVALDAGSTFHIAHGKQVARAMLLRLFGWLLIAAAVLLAAYYFLFPLLD